MLNVSWSGFFESFGLLCLSRANHTVICHLIGSLLGIFHILIIDLFFDSSHWDLLNGRCLGPTIANRFSLIVQAGCSIFVWCCEMPKAATTASTAWFLWAEMIFHIPAGQLQSGNLTCAVPEDRFCCDIRGLWTGLLFFLPEIWGHD